MITEDLKSLGFASTEAYTFPAIVNICVIRGRCPCRCVHCPLGILSETERKNKLGTSTIPLKLFMKVVDEMSSYPLSTLRIHGVGEPILWDSLPIAVRYASDRKVSSWLFTSLCTQRSSLIETIARNCSIIEVSANSYDPIDYKRTKGIDAFQQVVDNVELMKEIVESESLHTRVLVSRVESIDKGYDSSFVKYWKESGLVDDAFIRSYHDYNSLMPKRGANPQPASCCLVHWARFNIDSDGKAMLCFNELFREERREDLIFGDISYRSIKQIWHSEKLNMVRKAQIMGDYSLIKFADQIPCASCTSCQSLDSEKPTSETQIRRYRSEGANGQT